MANYDGSAQKIQERIARAKKLIYPQKQEEWERKVNKEAKTASPTSGSIDISLEVMEMLENGASVNEAYKRFLQLINFNTSLKWDSLSLILLFSKRGAEFYEAVIPIYGEMSEEDRETVEQIKRQNEEFEQAQYTSSGEYSGGGRTN